MNCFVRPVPALLVVIQHMYYFIAIKFGSLTYEKVRSQLATCYCRRQIWSGTCRDDCDDRWHVLQEDIETALQSAPRPPMITILAQ